MAGVPSLAGICADAMDGLALGVGIPDFPRCPIINLGSVNPGYDMAALVQGVPAAFHDSARGNWSAVGNLAVFEEFKGPADFVALFDQGGLEGTKPRLFGGGEEGASEVLMGKK